jgi:hypothetical protein
MHAAVTTLPLHRLAALTISCMALPLPSHAVEISLEKAGELSLNGVATLAATRAFTDNAADYRSANYLSAGSERTQTWDAQNDSILGLQASWTKLDNAITLVIQGVLASDTRDELKPRLDWLYAGWQAADSMAP